MANIDPNSAAYKAGMAHGNALSQKNGATQLPPVALPPPPDLQIPNFPSTSSLMQGASSQATSDINAQIAQIMSQAKDQANQINMAAGAAANSLGGIGDRTFADYRTAANDIAGFAHGNSGLVEQTANSEAEKVQQALQAAGQPGQANTGQGSALAHALFGLGSLPANTLESSGAAFGAAERFIPASIRGYGLQLGYGALGAGVQEAKAARAKKAELTHQYFSDSLQAATATAEAAYRKGELSLAEYRSKVDLATATATAQYHQALLDAGYSRDQAKHLIDVFNANTSRLRARTDIFNANTGRMNARTTRIRANNDATYKNVLINQGNRRLDISQENADTSANNSITNYNNSVNLRNNRNRAADTASINAQNSIDKANGYRVLKGGRIQVLPGNRWDAKQHRIVKDTSSRGHTLTPFQKVGLQGKAAPFADRLRNGFTDNVSSPSYQVSETDPGNGQSWSEAISVDTPQGKKIVGFIDHHAPVGYFQAIRQARASGNPYSVAAVTSAYADVLAQGALQGVKLGVDVPTPAPAVDVASTSGGGGGVETWDPRADPIVGAGPPGTGTHKTRSGRYVTSTGAYTTLPGG